MHSCCVEEPPLGGAELPSSLAHLPLALWLKRQVETTGATIDNTFLLEQSGETGRGSHVADWC